MPEIGHSEVTMPGLSVQEIQDFVERLHLREGHEVFFKIESIENGRGRVRQCFHRRFLRPGGTLSGPSLMRLVDASVYFVILGTLGPVYDTVTSNLNINFLRPAPAGDVIAEVELLKTGRKLAFADFKIFSEGSNQIVAHGTCTYALPAPKKVAE